MSELPSSVSKRPQASDATRGTFDSFSRVAALGEHVVYLHQDAAGLRLLVPALLLQVRSQPESALSLSHQPGVQRNGQSGLQYGNMVGSIRNLIRPALPSSLQKEFRPRMIDSRPEFSHSSRASMTRKIWPDS